MKSPVKICVLTCFHERAPMSEIFLHGIARLKASIPWVELEVFAGITETDEASVTLAKKWGANYVTCPNSPISNKWNRALAKAALLEWDYILIMGDDDIASPELFYIYREAIEHGEHFFGIRSIFFLEAETGRAYHFRYPDSGPNSTRTIGAGRMISRKACERASFKIWPDNINSSLDMGCDEVLRRNGIYPVVIETHRSMMLDIKSGKNLWNIDHFRNLDGSTPVSFQDATWYLTNDERIMINELPERMRELS